MADRYIDNTKESGTLTGANWQCTNGSGTVTETGAAGNAVAELSAGDYFRTTGGSQWYHVDSITDDDNFEISPDFQQGNVTAAGKYNNEDGSAVAQEFPHLNAVTTDETRSAGDIVRIRGGQTHVYAGIDITIDDNGAVNNYIELRGIYTAAGDDSWGDGDVAKPIISFGDTAFGMRFNNDHWWRLTGLDFRDSTDTGGALQCVIARGIIVDDCNFQDNGTSGIGLGTATISVFNSTFVDNTSNGIVVGSNCFALIDGCVFNSGASGTLRGINFQGAYAVVKDSTFGVTTEHSTGDFDIINTNYILARNCDLSSTTQVANITGGGREFSIIRIEDNDQTHLASQIWTHSGNISRTAAVERSGEGGTPWSMLGEPNSNCGLEESFFVLGDVIDGIPLYLDGTSQTIDVWAYADSTGGGWTPDASEFRIEIEHIEGSGAWDTDVSVDTFAAEDQWESFSITLTPFAAGFAYLRAVVNDNVAGAKVYIDPVPEVDGLRDENSIAATVNGAMPGYAISNLREVAARYHNV